MTEEIPGGWMEIRGEQRLVPFGGPWGRKPHYCGKKGPCPYDLKYSYCKTCPYKKLPHCRSCRYFNRTGICKLTGSFIHFDTEACELYESRNIKKVKVTYP